jgi:hypothetical protein
MRYIEQIREKLSKNNLILGNSYKIITIKFSILIRILDLNNFKIFIFLKNIVKFKQILKKIRKLS